MTTNEDQRITNFRLSHDIFFFFFFFFSFREGRKADILSIDSNPIWYKWAASLQNQQNDCALSEDSDQPGHPPSRMPRLIGVFAGRTATLLVLPWGGSNGGWSLQDEEERDDKQSKWLLEIRERIGKENRDRGLPFLPKDPNLIFFAGL